MISRYGAPAMHQSVLLAFLFAGHTCALALPRAPATPGDGQSSDTEAGWSIEANFSLVGVFVAVFGILIGLTWPRALKWLRRNRASACTIGKV